MRKNFIIDTNVMVHDPFFFERFEDNDIIIPIVAIEELDNLKSREGLVGFQARESLRQLGKMFRAFESYGSEISLSSGGTVRIEADQVDISNLPDGMDPAKNDNKILSVCISIKASSEKPTILVTKDLAMAIKANGLDIEAQDYRNDTVDVDSLYKGHSQMTLSREEISMIFSEGGLEIPEEYRSSAMPNHFYHVKSSDDDHVSLLVKVESGRIVPLRYSNKSAWGLTPRNMHQHMAFELLMDPSVSLVTLAGGAGSGKTILSVSVAIQKLMNNDMYKRIIFVRPVIPAGNDIGFLPGNEEDKLKPWMGSFYDAIDNLNNMRYEKAKKKNSSDTAKKESVDAFIEKLRSQGVIEMKTFNYMRGRSISDSIVIIDEAQQMTPHLAKLMLTRAGEGSKFIFIGDPTDNQIDNMFVDSKSNGLVYLIERLKGFETVGHITLEEVERSKLAALAEKYL